MPNITSTSVDTGAIVLRDAEFRNETYVAGGADELAAGTILARHTSLLTLQLYVKGGSSNGNGVPQFILTYPVSIGGAGNIPVKVLQAGVVNKDRLVIDADGNASAIDGTVIDLLRSVGIYPQSVNQLDG